ncbi:MAG: RsiG family protein [Mycobacteriales bacterium]
MTHPTGNTRIDRLLAPAYLAGLTERPIEDIREMRHDAEQEETNLSYLRRLIQGRVDILRAELARRNGEGPPSLVDALPEILADNRAPAHGLGRHAAVEPSDIDEHHRYVDGLVSDEDLSDPGNLDLGTLERMLDVLDREEAEVSRRRRSVQAVMDELTAELGRRYKDGVADVADLLHAERE